MGAVADLGTVLAVWAHPFELGRPRVCADDNLAVLLQLDGEALDRKVHALQCQTSQTGVLIAAVGLARYRAWVATEAFAEPEPTQIRDGTSRRR